MNEAQRVCRPIEAESLLVPRPCEISRSDPLRRLLELGWILQRECFNCTASTVMIGYEPSAGNSSSTWRWSDRYRRQTVSAHRLTASLRFPINLINLLRYPHKRGAFGQCFKRTRTDVSASRAQPAQHFPQRMIDRAALLALRLCLRCRGISLHRLSIFPSRLRCSCRRTCGRFCRPIRCGHLATSQLSKFRLHQFARYDLLSAHRL